MYLILYVFFYFIFKYTGPAACFRMLQRKLNRQNIQLQFAAGLGMSFFLLSAVFVGLVPTFAKIPLTFLFIIASCEKSAAIVCIFNLINSLCLMKPACFVFIREEEAGFWYSIYWTAVPIFIIFFSCMLAGGPTNKIYSFVIIFQFELEYPFWLFIVAFIFWLIDVLLLVFLNYVEAVFSMVSWFS